MKYFILLGDGMADRPVPELAGKTPLQAASTPTANRLAKNAICGTVQTIPDGMEPGSGPANMSVMGYDPSVYYTGRSPLEAVSLGIDMQPGDVVFRCNLVSFTAPPVGTSYRESEMLDYSAGEITSEESAELIKTLEAELSSDNIHFYAGRSYRHCMVWRNGPTRCVLTPPHDISGKIITDYLPQGEGSDVLFDLMIRSEQILRDHAVNQKRADLGKNPANSIWLWGQGTRPGLPAFQSLYGKSGAVISAVDLVFGIGRLAGMELIEVPGATGTLHTNYAGKAEAAIRAFASGKDYVYLHVEAPDECGHQGDYLGKIQAIERIDFDILSPVYSWLSERKATTGEEFRLMFLPDHPTPVSLRTHTSDAVPFLFYASNIPNGNGAKEYNEIEAAATGLHFATGPDLFRRFIRP
ncbi:MAG: cofactor-independent phosphoglycerate mutase [Clostridiales bacterium]|nr:cofactor-independent phosphoglycerate mutase [Clostridiales bacterium]